MSAFFEFYSNFFGSRWESLRLALSEKNCSTKLQFDETLAPYFLDEASVFAAKALDVKPGMQVLDMCAAPGGKTLILASALSGEGSLQCNDRSNDRRERLAHVIENTLPESWRKIISISGYDGNKFGRYKKETFDKILLDAPCSSERHVLNSEEHLKVWTKNRIKRLSVEQGSLLASAIDALKPGGEVVYSTCALTPFENDAVVEKILKKRAGLLEIISLTPKFKGTEITKYGLSMLPDYCEGRGPIFCAKLKKKI